MKHTKQKNALRLAPCPGYDIEGLESWLGDMAREGLFLKKHGVHLGVFCFIKGTPQQMTYRLEATKNPGLFSDEDNMPTEDVLALYGEFGWHYIARHENFDIYASADAAPRELNTDPTLHAQTLNTVKKRQLWALLPLCLQIGIYAHLLHSATLLAVLSLGTPLSIFLAVVFLHWLFLGIAEILHLSHLRRQLSAQGALNHKKNWKKGQRKHLLRVCVTWCSGIALLACFALAWHADTTGTRVISMTEYDQDPPFATLSDLMGEDADYTYTPQAAFDGANTVETWQDFMFTQNISWTEVASISQNGTLVLDAYYTVEYHQLASEWLAHQLAKEYSTDTANGFRREEIPTLASIPDADYFAIYDVYLGVTFIIQQGDTVACITFYNYLVDDDIYATTEPFTIEECIATVSESLL